MMVKYFTFVIWSSAYPTAELDIPPHMIPPNPDDSDSLYLLHHRQHAIMV
jgi:hypothetical protein